MVLIASAISVRIAHIQRAQINSTAPVFVAQRNTILSFLKELFSFLKARKKFWLVPILLIMALLGALIVLAQGSAIAPFIYTLF